MNRIVEWLFGLEPGEQFSTGEWRFIGDYPNWAILLMVAVFLALSYLVVRSYRREGDAPRPGKGLLAGVRILILVLVFVVLFRPATIFRRTTTLYRPVVVLTDDSRSMDFKDSYDGTEGQELLGKLTRFYGIGSEQVRGLTRKQLVQWALGRRGGVIPRLALDHPLLLLQFSTSQPGKESYTRAMGSIDLVRAGASSERTAEPNERIRWLLNEYLAILRGVETRLVQGEGRPVPLEELTRRARTDAETKSRLEGVESKLASEGLGETFLRSLHAAFESQGQMLSKLRADGHETDFAEALYDAFERTEGQRLIAMVLVSDGQLTARGGDKRLRAALERARRRGVPIHTVWVGDPTPPKRISVTGLQAPEQVRKGSQIECQATVTYRNVRDGFTVRLERSGAAGKRNWTPVMDQPVTIDPAPESSPGPVKGVRTVTLRDDRTDEKGTFVYRAVVVGPGVEKLSRAERYSAPRKVVVSDDKINVLLISGDAGWEFQYLRNYLYRQPKVFRLSTWQQNADPAVNQAASTGMRLKALPRKLSELIGNPDDPAKPGYDAVILYDPEPKEGGFDAGFVELLKTFVKDHGGGLCYVASNKYSEPLLGREGFGPLADMLPVVLSANTMNIAERIERRRPEAWQVVLTAYGMDHPITRLGGDPEQSQKIWQILPGIYWSHQVAMVKPGARVLAVNSNPARQLGDDIKEPEPLIAVQPFGSGRAVYVGSDGTWRWRFVEDGEYHRRFWGNVVRYLSSLKGKRVVISTGGERFAIGEKITVEVQAYDENYKPLTDETYKVRMVDTVTHTEAVLELEKVKGKPGRYKKTLTAEHTGTYEITAATDDPKAAEKVTPKTLTITRPKAESQRPEADPVRMRNIASGGGNFHHICDIDRLAELIPSGQITAVHETPRERWDCPLTVIVIVLLLGGEWIVRKKFNMA